MTSTGFWLAMLWLTVTSAVLAQSRTYTHRAADGSVTFSDFPMHNGAFTRSSYKSDTRPASVVNPCRGLTRRMLLDKGRQLDRLFLAASRASGVDMSLIKAVARAESCFDPMAVSIAGAKGLMQLMPATAAELGVTDIFDREQNVIAGANYLAQMFDQYPNDLDRVLAAYNAGPGNVEKYKGVPPFPETIGYIRSVKKFQRQFASLTSSN